MASHLRLLLVPLLLVAGASTARQTTQLYASEAEIDSAIARAQAEGRAARQRAERLEAEAARTSEALEKTAREAAGVAARIQQTQAQIAAHEAGAQRIARKQALLRARLAERQRPLVRLTAALQQFSRSPPVLSLLRPGSIHDAIHMRALLDAVVPEVQRRTVALRAELAGARALQRAAMRAARDLRLGQAELRERRQRLVALEARQRLASRDASGIAAREAERALALAEQARDLDDLSTALARAGQLRQALAALPGPLIRPAKPGDAKEGSVVPPAATAPRALPAYALPVRGRLVAGFGDSLPNIPASRGVALATSSGAQAVAPAPGRVAFAGPYRGYGRIVIIEHVDGWTSLITGLAQLDVRIGDALVAGSPIGIAGAGHPVVMLELRREGTPVNPLEFVGPD